MTPATLRRKILLLEADLPLHKALEHALREGSDYGAWYSSQKEHWLGWLAEYDGPGAYGRQTGNARDAGYVYTHIQCAPMLFWLAEALHIAPSRLAAAERAVLEAPRRHASRCAAFRRVIPWADIEQALKAGPSPRPFGAILKHWTKR